MYGFSYVFPVECDCCMCVCFSLFFYFFFLLFFFVLPSLLLLFNCVKHLIFCFILGHHYSILSNEYRYVHFKLFFGIFVIIISPMTP